MKVIVGHGNVEENYPPAVFALVGVCLRNHIGQNPLFRDFSCSTTKIADDQLIETLPCFKVIFD